jgi:hypothetical protein
MQQVKYTMHILAQIIKVIHLVLTTGNNVFQEKQNRGMNYNDANI